MLLEIGNRVRRAVALCWLAAPLAWMGVIYWFSAQPSLPQAPDALIDLLLKKGAHVVGYAVLLVLWWRALSTVGRPRPIPRLAAVAIAWVLTVLYAVADEYHQKLVLGRHGRLTDATIDAIGASIAVLAIWWSERRRAKRSRQRA